MTDDQIAVFMEERKWHYRGEIAAHHFGSTSFTLTPLSLLAFGFAAALLESLPIVGLVFTVSNRVGAAMWAHGKPVLRFQIPVIPKRPPPDLEKRQHAFASGDLPPEVHRVNSLTQDTPALIGSFPKKEQ